MENKGEWREETNGNRLDSKEKKDIRAAKNAERHATAVSIKNKVKPKVWQDKILQKRKQSKPSKDDALKLLALQEHAAAMILDGIQINRITKSLRETFSCTVNLANKAVDEAFRALKEATDTDIQFQRTLAIRRYNDLYLSSKNKGNTKGALAAQKELCILLGLNAAEKRDISLTAKTINEMSDVELEAMLAGQAQLKLNPMNEIKQIKQ